MMTANPNLAFTALPASPNGLDSRIEIPPGRVRFVLGCPENRDWSRLQLEDGSRLMIKETFAAVWNKLKAVGWTPPPYTTEYLPSKQPRDPWQRRAVHDAEALQLLLEDGNLFVNYRPFVENSWQPREKWTIESQTMTIFVNANDILFWGCADATEVSSKEDFQQLYELWAADPFYGTLKYTCWKQNMQPQRPWQRVLKEVGHWDEMLESLPANPSEGEFDGDENEDEDSSEQ